MTLLKRASLRWSSGTHVTSLPLDKLLFMSTHIDAYLNRLSLDVKGWVTTWAFQLVGVLIVSHKPH